MSQHDMVIDNGPGLAVRTDINAALAALVRQNSGPIEPAAMFPGMLWLDTTVSPDGLMRMRNQANTAWIAPTVLPATAGDMVLTVLMSSGTYTKPAGLKFLEVTCVGGGGGSSRAGVTAAGQGSAGGGGGGAGTVYKFYKTADLSATEACTVGAGGTSPGGIGGAGGNSTFKGLTAGAGGGGGALMGATVSVGQVSGRGSSGAATGGDLNIPGSNGEQGVANGHNRVGLSRGGRGGSAHLAIGRQGDWTAALENGVDGQFPGAGASGGAAGGSQAAGAGGVGGAGAIILREYF